MRRVVIATGTTVTLAILAWEMAYDINDPTIPLVRELLFTTGSLFGITAFLTLLLRDD